MFGSNLNILQVSEKGQACGRAFGLFGCTSEGCGRKAGSWRAFTFPFEVSVHRVKKPPLQAAGLSLPKVQNESIDWGVKDTLSWGDGDCQEQPWGEPELSSAENTETSHSRSLEGTTFAIPGTAPQEDGHSPAWPVGAVVSGDTLEYAKLLNQLDTALNLRQETCRKPQAQLRAMLRNGHDSEESSADCKQVSIASLALPEFFLWDMAEPATKESILSRKEQHHIAELLQKYQQEEVEPQVSIFEVVSVCSKNEETLLVSSEFPSISVPQKMYAFGHISKLILHSFRPSSEHTMAAFAQ